MFFLNTIIEKAEALTFKHPEHKLAIPSCNDPRGPDNMI
jgi:hypothetical protein